MHTSLQQEASKWKVREEDYLRNLIKSTEKCPHKFADSWENILGKRHYGTIGLAQYGHPDVSMYSVVCWGQGKKSGKKQTFNAPLLHCSHLQSEDPGGSESTKAADMANKVLSLSSPQERTFSSALATNIHALVRLRQDNPSTSRAKLAEALLKATL